MYIIRDITTGIFQPPSTPYATLDAAREAALNYSRYPLDTGTPAYAVVDAQTGECTGVAIAGSWYVRADT